MYLVLVGLLEAAVIGGGLPFLLGRGAVGDDTEDAKDVVSADVDAIVVVAQPAPA